MPEDERYISDGEAGSAGEAPQVSTNFHVHMSSELAQSFSDGFASVVAAGLPQHVVCFSRSKDFWVVCRACASFRSVIVDAVEANSLVIMSCSL